MCESLLLVGDYDTFDHYIKISENTDSIFKKGIDQEISDQIIISYLKSVRNLLVKNQGEAEKSLIKVIELIKKDGLPRLNWDFIDLQTSRAYQDLNGECKNIAENLIAYLSGCMAPIRKTDFENKNFASQLNPLVETENK
jgi:hypothetical protein